MLINQSAIPNCKLSLTHILQLFRGRFVIRLFEFLRVINSYRSLSQGIESLFSGLASPSAIRLASSGASRLGVGRIADNHVTVNKHEGMLNKFEGFHAEAIVARRSRKEFHCVVNSATEINKHKMFTTDKGLIFRQFDQKLNRRELHLRSILPVTFVVNPSLILLFFFNSL